jgi:hypothetical protein
MAYLNGTFHILSILLLSWNLSKFGGIWIFGEKW